MRFISKQRLHGPAIRLPKRAGATRGGRLVTAYSAIRSGPRQFKLVRCSKGSQESAVESWPAPNNGCNHVRCDC